MSVLAWIGIGLVVLFALIGAVTVGIFVGDQWDKRRRGGMSAAARRQIERARRANRAELRRSRGQ